MQAKEKLSDFAHDKLKEMILNNTFKPGEHLEEAALCDMLKISRTPLREAINRLVNEHLLIAVPQKGIFIPDLSIQDVTEIFRARKMFEPMIIMLSADKMDRDVLMKFRQDTLALLEKQNIKALHDLDYKFHGYINASCGNHFIYQYTVLISDQFQRVRTQNFYPVERAINGAKEHIVILDNLIRGEYDELPQLMLDHIKSTESYYYKKILENDISEKNIDFIKKNPADFR